MDYLVIDIDNNAQVVEKIALLDFSDPLHIQMIRDTTVIASFLKETTKSIAPNEKKEVTK